MAVKTRHECIFGGIGGKGVLVSGKIVADAAMHQYPNIVWYPAYGSAMRGGTSECTVILSNDLIACPVMLQAETVLVIAPSELKNFIPRVKPGGLLIVESTDPLPVKIERQDIKVMEVPGVKIAIETGDIRAANLVLVGAYIGATGAVDPEIMEADIAKKLGGSKETQETNKKAFRAGMKFAQDHKK